MVVRVSVLFFADVRYSWSAVVRGAAATGLETASNPVMTRKSRRHYGTGYSTAFVRGLHLECDSFYSDFYQQKRVGSQAKWLIAKGQDLPTSDATHVTMDLSCDCWPEEDCTVITNLLACDAELSPSRTKHTVSRKYWLRIAKTNIGQTVYTVAKLTVDLSDVPIHLRRRQQSPSGRMYYSIAIVVNISLQSSLEFFVTVNGQKYDTVTVEYE